MRITHENGHLWCITADHDSTDFLFINLKDGVFSFHNPSIQRILPPSCSTVMGDAWEEAIHAHSTVPTLGIAVQGVAIDTNLLPIKPLDI